MAVINFLYTQDGTDDPSLSNIRQINAPLNINEIGEIGGGSIDTTTGELIETWTIKILNGSENWYSASGTDLNIHFVLNVSLQQGSTNVVTDWIPTKYYGDYRYKDGVLCCCAGWGNNHFYVFNTTKYLEGVSSLATWKTFLSEHNLKICYKRRYSNTHKLTTSQLHQAMLQLGVQPRSLIEDRHKIMMNEPHIVTTNGGIVNFNTDISTKLKSCKLTFTPKQAGGGTPSPTNIREIIGRTGIECYRSDWAHDCAPNNTYDETINGITFEYLGQGEYHFYGHQTEKVTSSSIVLQEAFTIPADSTTTAKGRLHLNNSDTGGQLYLSLPSGVGIDYWSINSINREIPSYSAMRNKTLGQIHFVTVAEERDYNLFIRPIFMKNLTNRITFSWTNTIGTVYGGELDLISGVLKITYIVDTITAVNYNNKNYDNEDSCYYEAQTSYHFLCMNSKGVLSNKSYVNDNLPNGCKCNWLRPVSVDIWRGTQYINCIAAAFNTDGRLSLRIDNNLIGYNYNEDTKAIGNEKMITYLTEHPLHVGYIPKEDITYQLTPNTLKVLQGSNSIWTNANGLIELSYYTH